MSTRLLFLCLAASAGLCSILEEVEAASAGRSTTFALLSDPALSLTEIKGALNEQRVKYFGVAAEGDSLTSFLDDYAFEGRSRLADAIVENYGSTQAIEEDITKLIDSNFPVLADFLKTKGFDIKKKPSLEEAQHLKDEYTKALSDLLDQIAPFVRKELALRAAEHLKSQSIGTKPDLKSTVYQFFLDQLSGKLNEFLKATRIECVEARKDLEVQVRGKLKITISAVLTETRNFFIDLINAASNISREARYSILLVQSGQVAKSEDVEVLFFRVAELAELLTSPAIAANKNYITPMLSNVISLNGELEAEENAELVQTLDRGLVENFDVGIVAALMPLEIRAGRSAEVLLHLKRWFAPKMPTFNQEAAIPATLTEVLKSHPSLAYDEINGKAITLLQLDLIAYSHSDLEVQEAQANEQELPERAGAVELTDEQILEIGSNFINLASLTPAEIGLLTRTKELIISGLINYESDLELYAWLYQRLGEFTANHAAKLEANQPWNMEFDLYLDQLYETSNDLFLQDNYFRLKLLNVVAYGNQVPRDFNFLSFAENERAVKNAAAFLANPQKVPAEETTTPEFEQDDNNTFFKNIAIFAQRKMSGAGKNMKDAGDLANYFSKGHPSKTEYFAGFDPQIITTSYKTNYLIQEQQDERIGVSVTADKARLHFLTLEKQVPQTTGPETIVGTHDKEPVNLPVASPKKEAGQAQIDNEDFQPIVGAHDRETLDLPVSIKQTTGIDGNTEDLTGPVLDEDKEERDRKRPNDLGLLDNLHEIGLEPNFDEKVRNEQKQLQRIRDQQAKVSGPRGTGQAQKLEDELDGSPSKNQPSIQVIDNGIDESSPIGKRLLNQKRKRQPSNKDQDFTLQVQEVEQDPLGGLEDTEELQEELDESIPDKNSLLAELDPETFKALSKKRRGGQFFDEAQFNLPQKDEDELNPGRMNRALNQLKQNLSGTKPAQGTRQSGQQDLGEPTFNFELLENLGEEYDPLLEGEDLDSSIELPPLVRKNAVSESKRSQLEREDSFHGSKLELDEIESPQPRRSLTPNKIANKDKNFVRVIEGPKDDPIAALLEDMDVLDVVRDYQGTVDEQGRKVEIVYIQVARANSPCARKIAELRARQQLKE